MLADRVVVLSPRPGRVVAELPVDAAAPARAPPTAALVALRERALEALAERVMRAARCSLAALLPLGAWELYAELGARRLASSCPRRTRSPQSLWDDRALLWRQLHA